MISLKLIWLAAAGLVGAVGAVYTAVNGPRAKARRRLRAAATELVDGALVTLVGQVRARTTIEAPFSGTACVAYGAVAQLAGHNHPGQPTASNVYTELESVPFDLETKAGTVVVEGAKFEIVFATQAVIPRRLERERAYFTAHGITSALQRTSTCEECIVQDGDRIKVNGRVVVEIVRPDQTTDYRGEAKQIRLVPDGDRPLIFDRA